jgi:hypothetical protein
MEKSGKEKEPKTTPPSTSSSAPATVVSQVCFWCKFGLAKCFLLVSCFDV